MEGVWATIFICHLIFGGHLLNIPQQFAIMTHRLLPYIIYDCLLIHILDLALENTAFIHVFKV